MFDLNFDVLCLVMVHVLMGHLHGCEGKTSV